MKNHEKHIRVFIAISLPKNIIEFLKVLQIKLKKSHIKASWPSPQSLHLTLKFIGDIHPDKIDTIKECMQSAVLQTSLPIRLSVSGIGVFPNAKRTRIVWAGMAGQVDVLEKLVSTLSKELNSKIGVKIETKRYLPHFTLARVKKSIHPAKMQGLIQTHFDCQSDTFIATDIKLFKSELKPSGAIHTKIFSCKKN